MKKINVILVLILAISLPALAYFGGLSSEIQAVSQAHQMPMVLEVPFMDRDIDLNKGISVDVWDSIPPAEVEMELQVLAFPWGKGLINPVIVKAFQNGKDIYFYMSWKDDTENRNLGLNELPDAAAIMFPLGEDVQNSTIMMGFMGIVNIWQWKADSDKEYWLNITQETNAYSDYYYPFEENETFVVSKHHRMSVHDLNSIRVGTLTHKPYDIVQGRGFWDKGTWRVVFKRSIKPYDPQFDAVFKPGEKKSIAFAVWNGANGDRGSRKSISHDWTTFEIMPVEGTK